MAKNKEKISMEITKEQLKELLAAASLYSWIRGGLADSKGEDFKQYEELEGFILKAAKEHGFSDLAEEFHGALVPADAVSKLVEETVEEYEDDVFWHELVVRLGKRDFYRTVTPEEKKEMEERQWLPERVHEIYEKYEDEFEEHGIDRLKLDEEKV